MTRDRTVPALVVACVLLLAAAPLAPQWLVFLLALSLAKGLVVLGLILLMRTGLVSFGQGLYFGLGAYSAALLANRAAFADAALMIVAGTACAAALAAILGLLLARYREIFFAMLSLAFSMILYGALVKSSALGSTDGFNLHAKSFAGVALAVGHVDPETAYWTTSGEFVFVAILGGTGSVLAPFVSAAIFEELRTIANQYAPNVWQMSLGLAMLAIIMFLPGGLWTLIGRRRAA
jgi:ABC-type branched-subunit amino acid transport system permease subunit